MSYWEMNQTYSTAEESEYPQMQCKEVVLSSLTTIFPLFFGAGFGMISCVMIKFCVEELTLAIQNNTTPKEGLTLLACIIPFLAVAVGAVVILVRNIKRYIKVKKYGEPLRAKVCGYADDYNMQINNQPTQIVKLLVYTSGGWKSLSYRLFSTSRPYEIDSTIEILIYENMALIPRGQ